jgi:hypothetical protein
MQKHARSLSFALLLTALLACQTNDGQNNSSATTPPVDSLTASSTPAGEALSPDAEAYLSQLHEEWDSVPNPLVATYQGAEFGDYLHVMFEDGKGRTYDFGNGQNSLGGIALYDADYLGNPEYIGKEFRIEWAWKKSSFYCCEGEMNTVEAPVPSITRVEPLPN